LTAFVAQFREMPSELHYKDNWGFSDQIADCCCQISCLFKLIYSPRKKVSKCRLNSINTWTC